MKARGLTVVELVISDAREGWKAGIGSELLGASWQRCRVHFMRNVLAKVPKGHGKKAVAAIRTMLGRQPPFVEARTIDAKTTCWPSPHSRPRTGARSGPPTRWNG